MQSEKENLFTRRHINFSLSLSVREEEDEHKLYGITLTYCKINTMVRVGAQGSGGEEEESSQIISTPSAFTCGLIRIQGHGLNGLFSPGKM